MEVASKTEGQQRLASQFSLLQLQARLMHSPLASAKVFLPIAVREPQGR